VGADHHAAQADHRRRGVDENGVGDAAEGTLQSVLPPSAPVPLSRRGIH
jgi:hypothetical protein